MAARLGAAPCAGAAPRAAAPRRVGPSPAAPALRPLRTRTRGRRHRPAGAAARDGGGRRRVPGRPAAPAEERYLARCFTGLRRAGGAGEGPGSAPPRRALPAPGLRGVSARRAAPRTRRRGWMSHAAGCRHPPVTPPRRGEGGQITLLYLSPVTHTPCETSPAPLKSFAFSAAGSELKELTENRRQKQPLKSRPYAPVQRVR